MMEAYPPPVDKLLTLGRPDFPDEEPDYSRFGPEHVPELIRLLLDEEARDGEGEEDRPRWYASIHAWRAPGQLRATEAVEPLLDIAAENGVAEDWSDWVPEELPGTTARIGPQALPHVNERQRKKKLEKKKRKRK